MSTARATSSAHSGRHDDAAAGNGYFPEVWQIGDLTRRNFPPVHIKFGKAIDRDKIEWRAHEPDAYLAAQFGKPRVGRQRKMYLAAHLQLRLSTAGGLFLIFGLRGIRRDDQLRHRGLELDIIGSGFFGGMYHFAGHVEVSVMVHAGLGDYDHVLSPGLLHCRKPLLACNVKSRPRVASLCRGPDRLRCNRSAYIQACLPQRVSSIRLHRRNVD